MSILDNVKDKLRLNNNNNYDNYDDYDDYDDEYYDYDDGYADDRRSADRSWGSNADASFADSSRRSSRVDSTPLVTNADVRSTRRPVQDLHNSPDYESGLQNYKIESRLPNSRDSKHSKESLDAAREELDQLQRGVAVPLNSLQSGKSYDVPSTVSRRIVPVTPVSYNDAKKVADAFRAGSSVVVSLTAVPQDLRRRLLDFCFGVVSVSGGTVEKIGEHIFFLSRGGISLTDSERQQLSDAGIL